VLAMETKGVMKIKLGLKELALNQFLHILNVIIKSGKYCFKFDKQESNNWNSNWGKECDWKTERKADNKDEEIKTTVK